MKQVLFETDWLGSQPVFYNEKTSRASHNVNEVIDCTDLEFHPEGLNNYLDFGYSVLEQTPVRHVKFMRHSSRLWRDEDGLLSIEYLDDPIEQWIDYRLSETDVIDLIKKRVREWEHAVDGEIVIPTSGGYDSRLLNWCIEDKTRIRSFSYGISDNQSESYEVVYARQLSEILGTQWGQIPLGDFHRYYDDWDRLFGVSTHAHGMYHFEFYNKILPKIEGGNPFLSGIFGDVWAGSTHPPVINSYSDLNKLGYTHNLNADIGASLYSLPYDLRRQFLEVFDRQLKDERFRIIIQIRLKILLISYLLSVPEFFGFRTWSPFLDVDVCMAMLNLPQERRENRVWQKEFFKKAGLSLETMNLRASHDNTLDIQALRRLPVRPLDAKLLCELVKAEYVEWINRSVSNKFCGCTERVLNPLLKVGKLWRLLSRFGLAEMPAKQLEAYNAYNVLLPIEKLLRRCAGG